MNHKYCIEYDGINGAEFANTDRLIINGILYTEGEKGKICKDCNLCQVTDLKDWSATCNNPNSKKYLNFVEKYESCDVPEREKGKWIEKEMFDGDIAYECSECGELFCLISGTPTDNLYNFCPNCGADMRGEI